MAAVIVVFFWTIQLIFLLAVQTAANSMRSIPIDGKESNKRERERGRRKRYEEKQYSLKPTANQIRFYTFSPISWANTLFSTFICVCVSIHNINLNPLFRTFFPSIASFRVCISFASVFHLISCVLPLFSHIWIYLIYKRNVSDFNRQLKVADERASVRLSYFKIYTPLSPT